MSCDYVVQTCFLSQQATLISNDAHSYDIIGNLTGIVSISMNGCPSMEYFTQVSQMPALNTGDSMVFHHLD